MGGEVEFRVVPQLSGRELVLELSGQLLREQQDRLQEELLRHEREGLDAIILDLAGLEMIDSSGLGMLTGWYRRLLDTDTSLRVRNARGNVLRSFELTNLSQLFRLDQDEANTQRERRRARWRTHAYTQEILSGLGEGLIGADPEGRVLFMNPEAELLTGWSEAELSGKSFCESITLRERHGERFRRVDPERLHEACRRGPFHSLAFLRCRDGEEREYQLNITPVYQDDHKAGCLIGLSPPREFEDEDATNHEIYNDVQVGLFRCRIQDNRLVSCNRHLAEMLGFSSRQELIAANHRLIDAPPIERALLKRITEKGHVSRVETECRRKDGSTLWARLSARYFQDRGYYEGVLADISREMRVRKRLHEHENRFRGLLESVRSFLYSLDLRDGELTAGSNNSGWLALTGYGPEALEGNPLLLTEITHAEDRERVETFLGRVTSGERVPSQVFRICHREGGLRWIRATNISPLGQAADGTHFELLMEDVTEQQQLRNELNQAHKMETLGQLAGGVAHDFNNLLTGILGNLSLAEQEAPPGLKPLLGQVQEAGQRAANLVEQLLAFSRKQEAQQQPVDLCRVTREVVAMLSETIDKSIELCLDLPGDPHVVLADSNQMHQLVLNLCLNARDALEESGKTGLRLGLRVERLEAGPEGAPETLAKGPCIRLEISDNGTGMDADTRAHVFDPFFTTKAPGQGTGLGLPSARNIVEQHGGWIDIESREGEGTSLRVFLPESAEPEACRPKQPPAEPVTLPGGSETVLIVDDEDMILNLGRTILERLGYRVLTARDGQEGLEAYLEHEEQIGLTVLDISMPALSGIEVLKRIRERRPAAKIILSSGYAEHHTRARAGDYRESAFIAKPYRPSDLADIIRRVLDGERV